MKTGSMKNGNAVVCLFLSVCIVMNLYLIINNLMLRSRMSDYNLGIKGLSKGNLGVDHSFHIINNMYMNCGINLKNIYLTDINSHQPIDIKVVLDSIPDDKVVFVCRFNQNDCGKCVTYAIERAAIFAKKNDATLFVWGNFNDDHMLKVLLAQHSLSCRIHCYNVAELPVPIDQLGNPYYFVLNKEGIMVDFYTPDKMIPEMTDRYFNLIGKKWDSNEYQWF